ncbi:MAG: TonB-dependent receptor [Longimicrobiaceae bacterium]
MPFNLPGRAVCSIVMLVATATAAHATYRPPTNAAPPITGVVRDAAGSPLPNARVTLAVARRSTTTAADGTFTLGGVPPGSYHLDVSLLGYAPGHVEVTVPASGPAVAVVVTLRATPLALEGLNVTASPGGSDPLNVAQSTVQLSGKELDRKLGASVAQTLSDQPGISVRYAGPAASTPVIRGLSGDRVLVLQNGSRTGDLSGNSPDHGLTLDPLGAERIEVVRGPASLLYGTSALGGVVNVISSDIPNAVPSHLEGYLAGQGESVSSGGALSGQLTFPLAGRFAASVKGGFRDAGDVRVGGAGRLENSFFRNRHADLGVGYAGDRLSGGVAGGTYRFDYGLPAAPDAAESGVHLEGHREEIQARTDVVVANPYLTDLRFDGAAQWYTHDEIEDSGEIGTTFNLNTQTLGLTARTQLLPNAKGAIGASGLFRQYAATGEEALTPPADNNSGGIFVFQEVPLGRSADSATVPRLQLGARYDLYRVTTREGDEKFGPARSRDFDQFSASAGVTYPLARGISLAGSVARAFRAPLVEELFSNAFHAAVGTFDRGDPGLDAESNLGAEAVLRTQTGRVSGQAAVYANRIDGYIFPNIIGDTTVVEDDESFVVPLNQFSQADATLRGVEGRVEYAVAPQLVLGALGDVVRGDFVDGGPLPFIPPARLGGSVRWDNGTISAGGEVRHAFAQERVQPGELATDAYALVGVNFGYNLIRSGQVHTLTFRVDNLLDEEYRDAASRIKEFAPNPGRNFSLVYKLLF